MIQTSVVMSHRRPGFGSGRPSAEIDPYALHLCVQVERSPAELPAEPGLLVAAERGRGVQRMVRVDPHRARAEQAREPVRPTDILRPDARGEAVFGGVREVRRLLLVVEGHDRQHDALPIFPGKGVLGLHAIEDRRLDPVTLLLALVRRPRPAEPQLRALLPGTGDVTQDPSHMLVGDQRTVPRLRIERVAGLEGAGAGHQAIQQLIVDRAVHEQPRARRAALPRVVENPGMRPPPGRVQAPAGHHCPALKQIPACSPRTAATRSASGNTTLGDLPPSSSDTRFSEAAASRMIVLPTAVDPVNAILSTPGCRTSAAPAVSPNPGTTFSTPGGKPTSAARNASSRAVSGVCSAGFSTMVFPHASAGATFHAAMSSGKFHGMMAPTTPTGSRSV